MSDSFSTPGSCLDNDIIAAREHNRRYSLQNRLPDEVWGLIWATLPFNSRVSVSHVCSRWRSIALGYPNIWSDLRLYTTVHASDCECMLCVRGSRLPPGWADSPYRHNTHNFHTLRPLLQRCPNTAPLALTLDIVPYRPVSEDLGDVAQALVKNQRLIRDLCIRFCDFISMRQFLRVIIAGQCLQALRNATFEAVLDRDGGSDGSHILDEMPPFAHLQSVRLIGTCSWRCGPSTVTFPAVRSFTLQPFECPGQELRDVLSTCTGLTTLNFDLSLITRLRVGLFEEPFEGTAGLASGLRSVRISGLRTQYEAVILRAFPRALLIEMALEYDAMSEVTSGIAIFQDLGTYVHLRVSFVNCILSLEGTDETGRIRSVSASIGETTRTADLQRLIASPDPVLWLKVVNLSTDYSLWHSIAPLLPGMPSLMELELTVPARHFDTRPARSGMQGHTHAHAAQPWHDAAYATGRG